MKMVRAWLILYRRLDWHVHWLVQYHSAASIWVCWASIPSL